jgi:hypothetical protein
VCKQWKNVLCNAFFQKVMIAEFPALKVLPEDFDWKKWFGQNTDTQLTKQFIVNSGLDLFE